jgi:hypothetical protein
MCGVKPELFYGANANGFAVDDELSPVHPE